MKKPYTPPTPAQAADLLARLDRSGAALVTTFCILRGEPYEHEDQAEDRRRPEGARLYPGPAHAGRAGRETVQSERGHTGRAGRRAGAPGGPVT